MTLVPPDDASRAATVLLQAPREPEPERPLFGGARVLAAVGATAIAAVAVLGLSREPAIPLPGMDPGIAPVAVAEEPAPLPTASEAGEPAAEGGKEGEQEGEEADGETPDADGPADASPRLASPSPRTPRSRDRQPPSSPWDQPYREPTRSSTRLDPTPTEIGRLSQVSFTARGVDRIEATCGDVSGRGAGRVVLEDVPRGTCYLTAEIDSLRRTARYDVRRSGRVVCRVLGEDLRCR